MLIILKFFPSFFFLQPEVVKPLKAEKKEVSKLPVWRCSICTYENDEKLTYCEICGVIPVSSVKRKNENLAKGSQLTLHCSGVVEICSISSSFVDTDFT